LKHARVAAGRALSRGDPGAGKEAEFHEAAGVIARQIDVGQHSSISAAQVGQGGGSFGSLAVVATQLQHSFSIEDSEMLVKSAFPRAGSFFFANLLQLRFNPIRIEITRMNAPLRVRAIRLKEFDRLMDIERASFGADAYNRALFLEYFRASGTVFLAAAQAGRMLGYAVATVRGGRAELASIAVDPADRGRGAASSLLESLVRRLRRRGVVRLSLMVRTENRGAQALYRKYGLRRVRRSPGYYEDGADGWLMLRDF